MAPEVPGQRSGAGPATARLFVLGVVTFCSLAFGPQLYAPDAAHAGPACTELGVTCESSTSLRKSPHGRLAPNRFGRLRRGAGQRRARQLFGQPNRAPRFSGCPLNPNSKPVRMFHYRLGGHSVRLYFKIPGGFSSYLTDSPRFRTRRGVRVGSTFKRLRRAYGKRLRPLNLGSSVSTPRSGTYLFRVRRNISHWFSVESRRVTRISGGLLEICE